MPIAAALPVIIGAGAGIAGSVLQSKGKQTTTTQQIFDPTSQAMRSQLQGLLSSKLQQPLAIDPALLAGGLGNLNKLFASGVGNLQSQFSARGLGQSGLFGGSLTNLQLARMGKAGDLLNQLMGTAEERRNMTISQALQLSSPTGGTRVEEGSLAGGLGAGLQDLSSALGLLSALGYFSRRASSPSSGGGTSAASPFENPWQVG